MSVSEGAPVPTTAETHNAGRHRHQTEEEKRRAHLAGLSADSDVRAPGMKQRIKEEIQAVMHTIYAKICLPRKKDEA